ncbi:hypothetical protein TSOC_009347 [Tetrabaena socialis]|uniref:Uncharacterized protein n=1 Tax=Tetrabaena socialis TaxID=47790 RepID=A0A2J7ZW33_9CHLO|nr:hypothetical protein TSOC_009347 [Tetrabaena socialis]|eukprot:PNH04479.1 hypothetical protein TSOC_009347 [Tetrabaena socialis]
MTRGSQLHQRTAQQQQQQEGGGGAMGAPQQQQQPRVQQAAPRYPQLPPVVLDASTPKLLVPSRQALYTLLVLPYLLWGAAVLAGVLHVEPLPEGVSPRDFEHPLVWFDRHVFRVYGPLLPLAPYLVRVAAFGLRWPPPTAALRSAAAAGGAAARPLRPAPTLALPALLVYGAVIVVRIALYVCHVALERRAAVPLYLMSDHLLLAASVVACFQSELMCCLSDAFKAELLRPFDPRGADARQLAAVAAMVCSAFALAFVYGDMYCTARWYHHPAESLGALAAGAVLFQLPMALWLLRRASRLPGRV